MKHFFPPMMSFPPVMQVCLLGLSVFGIGVSAQAGVMSLSTPPSGILDIGNVRIGTTGSKDLKVTRTGNASGGALSGTLPGATGLFGPGTALAFGPIANGGNNGVTRAYTFTPTTHSSATQNITVLSNLGDQGITLSGTGVGPVYSSSYAPASTIDFGPVPLGTSSTLPLTVDNTTPDAGTPALTNLTILGYSITGPNSANFSLSNALPQTIVKNQTFDLMLTFLSFGGGVNKNALLTIFTDEDAALGQAGNSYTYNLQAQSVPEPSSWMLGVIGIVGMAGYRRRRAYQARASSPTNA